LPFGCNALNGARRKTNFYEIVQWLNALTAAITAR
jgi:hypothetical protein